MRDALLSGRDPFVEFVEDGIACIDDCLNRKLTYKGVSLLGTSRGAYCALRLAAADHHVDAVAAIAPVTDWRVLSEFEQVRKDDRVEKTLLSHWAPQLSTARGFVVIGNADRHKGGILR